MIGLGRRHRLWLLALLTLGACQSKQRTQLVIEVGSNLVVSSELDKVDLAITANGQTQHTPYSLLTDYKLPLYVGVVEASAGGGNIQVVATGYLNGSPIVDETAILSFIEGKSMLLRLFLAAECRGDPCTDPASTCTTGGTCRGKIRTPADLTPFDPSKVPPVADAAVVGTGGSAGTQDSGADKPT